MKNYLKHCKISFLIESYKGCSKKVHEPTLVQKHKILSAFSLIAKENNIQIEACAESGDWSRYRIIPSKCIDGEIYLFPYPPKSHNLSSNQAPQFSNATLPQKIL